jgi:hypothetical protein
MRACGASLGLRNQYSSNSGPCVKQNLISSPPFPTSALTAADAQVEPPSPPAVLTFAEAESYERFKAYVDVAFLEQGGRRPRFDFIAIDGQARLACFQRALWMLKPHGVWRSGTVRPIVARSATPSMPQAKLSSAPSMSKVNAGWSSHASCLCCPLAKHSRWFHKGVRLAPTLAAVSQDPSSPCPLQVACSC